MCNPLLYRRFLAKLRLGVAPTFAIAQRLLCLCEQSSCAFGPLVAFRALKVPRCAVRGPVARNLFRCELLNFNAKFISFQVAKPVQRSACCICICGQSTLFSLAFPPTLSSYCERLPSRSALTAFVVHTASSNSFVPIPSCLAQYSWSIAGGVLGCGETGRPSVLLPVSPTGGVALHRSVASSGSSRIQLTVCEQSQFDVTCALHPALVSAHGSESAIPPLLFVWSRFFPEKHQMVPSRLKYFGLLVSSQV